MTPRETVTITFKRIEPVSQMARRCGFDNRTLRDGFECVCADRGIVTAIVQARRCGYDAMQIDRQPPTPPEFTSDGLQNSTPAGKQAQ